MRWRTKAEVISGKGQFICAAKGCMEPAGLASYEVNFAYQEAGQTKQALVKVRLCEACAAKLNYRKDKQYKKVTSASAEQQAGKEPERSSKHKQPKRKDKKRDRHKERSRELDEPSDSRKRQRKYRSSCSGDEAHVEEQEQHSEARHVGGGRELDNADIDKWLDGLFASM